MVEPLKNVPDQIQKDGFGANALHRDTPCGYQDDQSEQ